MSTKDIRTWGAAFLLAACSLQPAAAAPSQPDNSARRTAVPRRQPAKDIERYFARTLQGEACACPAGRQLKTSEIAQWRQTVWEAWKTANRELEEDKLPPLAALSGERPGCWPLPDTLEPAAAMPFYWGSKGDSRPAAGWPLFLYLHGSGPKAAEWATGLALCSRFDDAPSAYFIPQIPNEGSYYRWWQRSKQFAWERLLRLAMASGDIDPDRMYVFGISEGGYGSQRLAAFYADYWAAAGPMAGGEPLRNAPAENCANLAFSLRTGAQDLAFARHTLTQAAANRFDSLQARYPGEFVHRIELIPGYGHGIDYFPTTPWLRQHVRNPYPRHVLWEDFATDGRRRRGFYNLQVDSRPAGDAETRTRYEMTITGNDIVLLADRVEYVTTQREPQWGIEVDFERRYTPLTEGRMTLYLCPELIDLNRKVRLTVNGRQVFHGKVRPDVRHIVNSCTTFFDPRRLYPAAIEIDFAQTGGQDVR